MKLVDQEEARCDAQWKFQVHVRVAAVEPEVVLVKVCDVLHAARIGHAEAPFHRFSGTGESQWQRCSGNNSDRDSDRDSHDGILTQRRQTNTDEHAAGFPTVPGNFLQTQCELRDEQGVDGIEVEFADRRVDSGSTGSL